MEQYEEDKGEIGEVIDDKRPSDNIYDIGLAVLKLQSLSNCDMLIAVLSFGLTCFGIGYTFGKDSNKPQK